MRCLLAVLALSANLAFSGCTAPVRPYTCSIERGQVDVEVHGVWSCNRDVLRRAAKGKPFSLRELRSAVRFFERLTGLRVDTRASHLGVLPGDDLRQDLEDLDAWYALHRNRLRWDRDGRNVVLDELAQAGGAV